MRQSPAQTVVCSITPDRWQQLDAQHLWRRISDFERALVRLSLAATRDQFCHNDDQAVWPRGPRVGL